MPRIIFIIVAIILSTLVPPTTQSTQAAQRCFQETGYCIDGRFREFWEQNGGLAIFGLPIGGEEKMYVDGKTIIMQRFERNRLEFHSENKRPYDVLLGRLGADRLTQQGRDWFSFPKSEVTKGCRVFAETGHSICGDILKAWRTNGLQIDGKKAVSDAENLALFGLPLSDIVTETFPDGQQYQVQWFERARFELHPENPAPYNVLLGLLGNEIGFDEAFNDRPLNEYSLQITDFPVGMSNTEYEYYSYEDAAKNWDDPVAALAAFERFGRVNSFLSTFERPTGVFTLDSGADYISLNIINFHTSAGASEFMSLQMKEKQYQMNQMYFPIANVNESNAISGNCNKSTALCTKVVVFLRKDNVCVRFYAGGYSPGIKMETLQKFVQILADRLNS